MSREHSRLDQKWLRIEKQYLESAAVCSAGCLCPLRHVKTTVEQYMHAHRKFRALKTYKKARQAS